MRPKSTPEVASQDPFPMNAALVQSEVTSPRVNARGVGRGRGRGRDSQAATGAISESSYVLRKGNTKISGIS
jgi:hypothetical protein